MLRAAVPEVPVIVIVYVPAGVPVAGVAVLLLLLHAGCKSIRPMKPPTTTPAKKRRRRELPLPIPNPRSANPETGSHVLYAGLEGRGTTAVVTGRAVVLMVSAELTGLILGIVTGVVEKAQVAPVGKPEQVREICELYVGIGVKLTV